MKPSRCVIEKDAVLRQWRGGRVCVQHHLDPAVERVTRLEQSTAKTADVNAAYST